MDFSSVINQKLQGHDKGLCCILVSKVVGDSRQPRVAAVVESHGEHGFFLYKCKQVPASKPSDLDLDLALPINLEFKFSVSQTSASQTTGTSVHIKSSSTSLLIEVPNNDVSRHFLSELKRTRQVYSQNAGFGITSNFVWINSYCGEAFTSPEVAGMDDLFDPLAANKDGWPFNQILQTQVGKNCPVVKDTNLMEHSASTPDFHSSNHGNISDSGSFQGSLGISQFGLEASQRSQSHTSLDQLEMPMTGETVTNSRDHLIRHLMKQREEEYIEIQNYRLFCGTWNTNGQAASAPIDAWLSPPDDNIPPDIYVIGFQELDLSKNAYIFSESPREEEWYRRVKKALHPRATYRKVKLVRLVGIMLVVFVRVELMQYFYSMMYDHVGTGILGMMGNKGGVGVRLSFHDTSICFINSHLAAHVDEYQRRNQDFKDISAKMVFGKSKEKAEYVISDHDMVFWIGDLNYRLSDIEGDRAKKLIECENLNDLMNYDQLCRQISLKNVFLDYVEGRVNFIPTYKYDPGTDNWDTSEKCRAPAWCDRILWRGKNVRQLRYSSHPECRVSDHKPVSAVFDIGVKVINQSQYRMVYEDIMKHLDRMENEFLPQVVLDTMDVHFTNVKFIEPQSQILTVTNTGQGPCQFEFINKPNDNSYCKPWLSVVPTKGIIDVGQKLELTIEVYVGSMTASNLNTGKDRIEDILVLHLEGGKDLFVTVTGSYIPSSFGTSLESLVNMFPPIRTISIEQVAQLTRRGEVSSDRPLDIPKEVFWLIDHLYKYGMQEDLFQVPGRHSEIQEIMDCLDTGTPEEIAAGQIHSVAEALLVFLEALPEPVIPCSVYYRCLDSSTSFSSAAQAVSDIPVCHRNVLKYVCAFLRELLKLPPPNNVDSKSLAQLFGELILRAPPSQTAKTSEAQTGRKTAASREDENKRCAFLHHFLVNEYDD